MFRRFWILQAIVFSGFVAYQGYLRSTELQSIGAIAGDPVTTLRVGSYIPPAFALVLASRLEDSRPFRVSRLDAISP